VAKTATMTIRIDPTIKLAAEDLYAHYGMSLTDAINVFIHQSLNVKGLPFDLRPNHETLAAFAEVSDMKKHPDKHKGYRDVSSMFEDILNESV
jgi:DNA-damage-inducible protein J